MTEALASTRFADAWRDYLGENGRNTGATKIVRVDYKNFRDQVFAADPKVVRDLVKSIGSGEIYILLNAFDPKNIRALKERLIARSGSLAQMPNVPKIDDTCPDYRTRRDWHTEDKGGYSSTYDMMHFYRWNDDKLGLYSFFDEPIRLMKTISGLAPTAFVDNLPSAGMIDRIEINHYPSGGGGIGFHSDPLDVIKFLLTATLTEYGVDYGRGGFAVGTKDGRILRVEEASPLGSMSGFFPSVCHGVEVIDPEMKEDWDAGKGRWYAGLAMVRTVEAGKREYTKPVANFPTLRQQIAAARPSA